MEVTLPTQDPLAERRGLPRLRCASAVQFRALLKTHELFTGSLSKDVSAGGVRLTTTTFLPKDARLVLLLSLPGDLTPIRAISRVAWTEEKAYSAGYESGLQFTGILPEDRDAIAGFVERGPVQKIWPRS